VFKYPSRNHCSRKETAAYENLCRHNPLATSSMHVGLLFLDVEVFIQVIFLCNLSSGLRLSSTYSERQTLNYKTRSLILYARVGD